MNQNQQYKKVKLYRTLKVLFYMLGLPLFIAVVFLSAVKFVGHDPFVGTSEFTDGLGFFMSYERLVTSPALFGVYIAFGIWVVISIVHIILSKVVKNPRARMFAVVALCLVIMMGGALCMDVVFDAKIAEIQASAPSGVVVDDYKMQLSYYRTISTNAVGKNDTKALIEKINLLEKVYNVKMVGENLGGTAGNISNKPITYGNIIADDGTVGVDISFAQANNGLWYLAEDGSANHNIEGDGEITKEVEGNQVVRLAPNANGQLVINGQVYSHYSYVEKYPKSGETIYVWYTKDMYPLATAFDGGTAGTTKLIDGVFGDAVYNSTGLLADGWVFSLENVLGILENYYAAQQIIAQYDPDGAIGAELRETAVDLRDIYYNGGELENGDKLDETTAAWMSALYNQEIEMTERFSLTRGELDLLLSKVGGLLGNNSLFDFLLRPIDGQGTGLDVTLGNAGLGSVADIIKPILNQLATGMSLGGLINNADTMKTVADIVKAITGYNGEINDMYIMLTYAGATDAMGIQRDGLYVAIVKDSGVQNEDGTYSIGQDPRKVEDGGDVLVDIDLRDFAIDADNSEYAFDLDNLSEFLNKAINGLLGHFNIDLKGILVDNTIGSLIGGLLIKDIDVNGQTMKGLVISGISIPLFDQNYNAKIDITSILTNLLDGLYSYQSAVIKPIWEFYECQIMDGADENYAAVVKAYADFERAQYEAVVHSKMIGSVILGDNLGAGTYPSSFGLADLASVQQLQADLSYKPVFYPLYALRDMLMLFTAFVVLFYFLSFVAHEKELEYATGKLVVKDKKAKKNKKSKEEKAEQEIGADGASDNANATNDVAKDKADVPVKQNPNKEVR